MNNQKKVFPGFLLLGILSANTFLIQNPAKANLTFDVRYLCITQQYWVETNGSQSGHLKYTAYQGSFRKEESPNRKPDLVLYNGNAYFQGKNKLVMSWTNDGGYVYQLTISGSRNGNTIGYPQSGNLTVKRQGRIILNQKCRNINSMEVTE
jgi:hypothetical protein